MKMMSTEEETKLMMEGYALFRRKTEEAYSRIRSTLGSVASVCEPRDVAYWIYEELQLEDEQDD